MGTSLPQFECVLNPHTAPVPLTERLSALSVTQTNDNPADVLKVLDDPQKMLQLNEAQKAMHQMMADLYQRNMLAFKEYMPQIFETFLHYQPKEQYEFFCTFNAIPNLFLAQRQLFFYTSTDPVHFCSQQMDYMLKENPLKIIGYDVEKDILGQIHHRYHNELVALQQQHAAEEDLDRHQALTFPTAILFGIGLGYPIAELCSARTVPNLILVEPNSDLFEASLHCFDWASFLSYTHDEGHHLEIIIEDDPSAVFEAIDAFYERHGRMLSGFNWFMQHYSSPQLNALVDQYLQNYRISFSSLGFFDDHLFGLSHALDAIRSGAHFVRNKVALPQAFKKVPLCLVANGPSLSHDLPFLRALQDKVVIMACGSALETLFNAGIKCTLYGATERLRIVGENLDLIPDKDYVRDTVLVTTDVIHPDTLTRFDHSALFGKSEEPFCPFLATVSPQDFATLAPIEMTNPLVGNLGLSAALELGFEHIYLFGVDNGTKHSDQLHPEENMFYKHVITESSESLDLTLPGNFGGEVHSGYLYQLSASYMEELISRFPHCSVMNCSDGAALKGAQAVHSSALLASFAQLEDFKREDFLHYIDTQKTFVMDLPPVDLEQALHKETFRAMCSQLRDMLTVPKEAQRSRAAFVLFIEKICEQLELWRHDKQKAFLVNLFDGTLYSYCIFVFHELFTFADEAKAIALAQKQIPILQYFLEDSARLYAYVPQYFAEDHHAFLKGKIGFDHPQSPAPQVVVREAYRKAGTQALLAKKFEKRYS